MGDLAGSEAPNPDVLLGLCVGERYELEELVGRGSTSLAFRARDTQGGPMVLVKLLFEEASNDRDAPLRSSGLRHPGIARVLECGRTAEEIPYVISELLVGRNVAEIVKRERVPVRAR